MSGIGVDRFAGSLAYFLSLMHTAALLFILRLAMASATIYLPARSRKHVPQGCYKWTYMNKPYIYIVKIISSFVVVFTKYIMHEIFRIFLETPI